MTFEKYIETPYATLFSTENLLGKDKDFYDKFNKKAEEIVVRKRLDGFIVRFLYESDCNGSASPTACKKIAELIKKSGETFALSYAAHVGPNETENIIKFLEECHAKKSRMEWS